MDNIKTLLVDDHQMVRDGIKSYLNDESNIEIIGEAANGEQAVSLASRLKPDLILMDISMPELNGMEAAAKIIESNEQVKIIMLSMYTDEQYIKNCMEEGVSGYIHKGADKHELIFGIKEVMAGEQYLSKSIRDVLLASYTKSLRKKKDAMADGDVKLTRREKEIVKLLLQGKTSGEIGEILFISTRTVDTHRANIMQKLKVKNAIELVNKVNKEGLLD